MIYSRPEADALVDQGDIIDDCPILVIGKFDAPTLEFEVVSRLFRVLVLTQACDLANRKVSMANVALVYSAEDLIEKGVLKAAEVRGPIRAGRVFGYYFLGRSPAHGLPESVIDLRSVHTVPLDYLEVLCQAGRRLVRIEPLYREHLSKHFADTFSRIGLPLPHESV